MLRFGLFAFGWIAVCGFEIPSGFFDLRSAVGRGGEPPFSRCRCRFSIESIIPAGLRWLGMPRGGLLGWVCENPGGSGYQGADCDLTECVIHHSGSRTPLH